MKMILLDETGMYDYSWSVVGVFYNPENNAYYVETDSGCSCYVPWDSHDSVSDFSRPYYSKREAISAIYEYRSDATDGGHGWTVEDINNMATTVREFNPNSVNFEEDGFEVKEN